MFCPKCSQQQISEEVRFCSRCGFQLGIVKALLVAEDVPGTLASGTPQVPDRSRRKRDVTFGALLMFICALFVAAVTVELPPGHSGPIVALVIFWLALSLLINIGPVLRYFFRGDASPAPGGNSLSKIAGGLLTRDDSSARQSALPPSQSVPAADYAKHRLDTSEVVKPPSVTEHTTNLLSNK
ncbi:MAG TPA: zinc ribbon domain-containing protein [Pyrinomonadaceae bacterium]|jgi:hypothetical protein|nr:zinc ribbon domain-containing protein [Pyrinomonadaceae bacterium]